MNSFRKFSEIFCNKTSGTKDYPGIFEKHSNVGLNLTFTVGHFSWGKVKVLKILIDLYWNCQQRKLSTVNRNSEQKIHNNFFVFNPYLPKFQMFEDVQDISAQKLQSAFQNKSCTIEQMLDSEMRTFVVSCCINYKCYLLLIVNARIECKFRFRSR